MELNDAFYAASADESLRPQFFKRLESIENRSNTESVYLGAAMTLMASEYFNPYQKLRSFENGSRLIDAGISADPNNAELRFVRYLIQYYAPSFLNYRGQMKEDLAYINKAIENSTRSSAWIKNYKNFSAAISKDKS